MHATGRRRRSSAGSKIRSPTQGFKAPPPPTFDGERADDDVGTGAAGEVPATVVVAALAIPPNAIVVVPALCATTAFAVLLPADSGLNSVSTRQVASTAKEPATQVVPAPSLKSCALVPPIATAKIVSGALPVFVSVVLSGFAAAPAPVDGKLTALASSVAAPVGVVAPGPARVTACGEPVAFDVIVRLPARFPAADGVNVTFIVQLAPAARLPTQLPVAANSGVVAAVTAVIATFTVLVFVIVTGRAALAMPTVWVLNVIAVTLREMLGTAEAVAVPVSVMLGLLEALDCSVKVAVLLPTAVGVNDAPIVQVPPAATVTDAPTHDPVAVNSAAFVPVLPIPVMVSGPPPLLVSVMFAGVDVELVAAIWVDPIASVVPDSAIDAPLAAAGLTIKAAISAACCAETV